MQSIFGNENECNTSVHILFLGFSLFHVSTLMEPNGTPLKQHLPRERERGAVKVEWNLFTA